MKFILTPELGRLSKWLRILGFDTVYFNSTNFSALLIQALRDNRIIITRNARLISKCRVTRTVQVKHDEVTQQLKQVLLELNIKPDKHAMFTRCIMCNTELKAADKQSIKGKVPEYVFKTQDKFFSCASCQRVYWQGTHWGKVASIIKKIQGR